MSKIGVVMSADRADGQMSSHFGKAEWIMVSDEENAVPVFVKNEGLNGKSAVEIAIRLGCTDVIFSEIGNGAFGHLHAAGIRAWVAPVQITGRSGCLHSRSYMRPRLQPNRVAAWGAVAGAKPALNLIAAAGDERRFQ